MSWTCSCGFKPTPSYSRDKGIRGQRIIRIEGHAPDNIEPASYSFPTNQHLVVRYGMPTVSLSPVHRHIPQKPRTETLAWQAKQTEVVVAARDLCRTTVFGEVSKMTHELEQLLGDDNVRLEYHYTNLGDRYTCCVVRYVCEFYCTCTLGPKTK